ncbi:hypothetical protein [Streptomyces albipurpureus]|uniref:Uncharacterized protein n=1 Tax=Streptomyces albipurpureus TaxID=2897419 RepID=A0ABT0UPI7_9ACTN|nr:hypothetical protein [Streptomyces sp. CWNU-1]MCM2390156.1 hypothetical protein [Streptomyces sp. CWNU-1]
MSEALPMPWGKPVHWAEAIEEGPTSGAGELARAVLGAFATPYVGRAPRRLSVQAVRIASGLES